MRSDVIQFLIRRFKRLTFMMRLTIYVGIIWLFRKDGNSIRTLDDLLCTSVLLSRPMTLSLALVPVHLFTYLYPDDDRGSDMLIANPHSEGRQVILDLAVTKINGQSHDIKVFTVAQ